MRYLLIISLFSCLVGCTTVVPVVAKFPTAPAELMEACPDLKLIEPGTTKLSTALAVVADNYSLYYQCQLKVENWIEWHNTQKKIFDSIK